MARRRPRILVVDDDQPILLLMQNLLKEFEFEPMIASSGPAALEVAREFPPDLILLDMHMPGISGRELILEFRSAHSLQDIPILILSGDPLDGDQVREAGASGAIQKPFDLGALVEQIRGFVNIDEQTQP